jgi:hypothetical protein
MFGLSPAIIEPNVFGRGCFGEATAKMQVNRTARTTFLSMVKF